MKTNITKKVFWEDPYLSRLKACVIAVDGNDIMVDQTIFFAESGGQESDSGTMNGLPVLHARKAGLATIYTLAPNHDLQVNDNVDIVIDWERRYRLMRLHFAAELILELCYQNLPGIEKIGAHIAQDKARLDFLWDENISAYFPVLLKEAGSIITADNTITSTYSDEASEKRFWEIEGFARVSCGGTHLKRTGEVGEISLKRNNIGRGKERIEIFIND